MTDEPPIHYGPLPDEVTVGEELPSGGMGRVWMAHGPKGEQMVLKRLPAGLISAGQLSRFGREVRLLAGLSCDGVPRVHAFWDQPEDPYLLMEFVPGTPLSEWRIDGLGADGAPGRTIAALAASCLETLSEVHASGILHRDLTPRNILVDEGGRPWIIDFGIAVSADATEVTETGDVLGTLRYLSPEQAAGTGRDTLSPGSDLYSFGLVLLEKLSGRPVRDADTREGLIYQAVTEDPKPSRQLVPGLQPELQRILDAMVARDPRDRYTSAVDVAADLRAFLAGRRVTPPRPPITRRTVRRWKRMPPPARFLSAAAPVTLVGLAAWAGYRHSTRIERWVETASGMESHREAIQYLAEKVADNEKRADLRESWLDLVLRIGHETLDHARAVELLGEALVFEPREPRMRLHRALRLAYLGRMDEALYDLREGAEGGRAIPDHPDNVAYQAYGLACNSLASWLALALAEKDDDSDPRWSWDINSHFDRAFRQPLIEMDDAVVRNQSADILLWRSAIRLPYGGKNNYYDYMEGAAAAEPDSPLVLGCYIQRFLMNYHVGGALRRLADARDRMPEWEGHWSLYEALIGHESGDMETTHQASRRARDLLVQEPHSWHRARVLALVSGLHLELGPSGEAARGGAGEEFDELLQWTGWVPLDVLLLVEAAALLGRRDSPELTSLIERHIESVNLEWPAWQQRQRLARWSPQPASLDPYGGALPTWLPGLEAAADPEPSAVLRSDEYDDLQAAVDAAPDGARIDLPPGSYEQPIQVWGKALHLRGMGGAPEETVLFLAPGTADRVPVVAVWGSRRLVLENLTLRGGLGGQFEEDKDSGETILTANRPCAGGGLLAGRSSVRVERCLIDGNGEQYVMFGGGIGITDESRVLVDDCELRGNIGHFSGGALLAAESEVVVRGSRIWNNRSEPHGGCQAAIGLSQRARLWLRSSIVARMKGPPIGPYLVYGEGRNRVFFSVEDSLLKGGWYGAGNRCWIQQN